MLPAPSRARRANTATATEVRLIRSIAHLGVESHGYTPNRANGAPRKANGASRNAYDTFRRAYDASGKPYDAFLELPTRRREPRFRQRWGWRGWRVRTCSPDQRSMQ